MHPAKSVILFTTASGAGYGLLAWLGILAGLGQLPAGRWFALAAFGLGLGLVVLGLLSSMLHLGHPERAWRALSQWRSSWLSREGVAAVLTFLPVGLFAVLWLAAPSGGGLTAALGLLASVFCLATVACTAMIYASLRTIRAWRSAWTLPVYLVLALMSGAVLLNLLLQAWGLPLAGSFAWVALLLLAAGAAVKLLYWRDVAAAGDSSAESATGLGGDGGKVRLLEAPHSESNYLMQEMGFAVARKHSAKLRCIALAAGFAAPFLLIALGQALPGGIAAAALAAAILAGLGLAIERWLFFAEAKHVVTLYYGESRA
ncbi:MAG: dimethyl sulfoxide reductase anchor subunit family protein [Kiloniellaceae bacterium]